MKTIRLPFIILLLVTFTLSCFIPKNNNDNLLYTTSAILLYKDSIDRSLTNLKKKISLPYTAGAYTFLITKYHQNGEALAFIEREDHREYGSREKRYYLRKGKLVLYTENAIQKPDSIPYRESRAFYINDRQFSSELKISPDKEQITPAAFKKPSATSVDWKKTLRRYEDAINQSGQFNLSFDGIIEYPKARYIVLQNETINPYRSSLLVKKQDNFISELINNPAGYRGRKLKMSWVKKDDEYVYVSGAFK